MAQLLRLLLCVAALLCPYHTAARGSLRDSRYEEDSWTCYVLRVSQSFVNARDELEFKYDVDAARHLRKCFDAYYQRHQLGFPTLITMTLPTGTNAHESRLHLKRVCRDGTVQTFRLIKQLGRKATFRSRVVPQSCRGPSFGSLYFRMSAANDVGGNAVVARGNGARMTAPKARVQLSRNREETKLRAWQCSLVTAQSVEGGADHLTFKYSIQTDQRTQDCTSKYVRKYENGYLQHLAVFMDDDFLRSLQLDKEEIDELAVETIGSGVTHYLQSDSKSSYHLIDLSSHSTALEAVHITVRGKELKSKWEESNPVDIQEAWKTPKLQLLFKI